MARPNPLTEPLEPYEPTSSFDSPEDYDWDYEGERERAQPMNILWGRVAVLGGMLLVAFLAGRALAGGGEAEAPASELAAAEDTITDLTTDNDSLRDENAALLTQVAELESAAVVAPTDTDATGETAETPAGISPFTEYTVQPKDTLSIIAEKFYDDASLDNFLAEVNNIEDPTNIHPGDVLKIPDNPPDS